MLPDGSIRWVETAARVIRDADGTPTELIGPQVGLRQIAGLCSSAILQRQPWVVTDAAADPGTLVNPLVAGEFGLRFYAGVPLTTHDGHNLGILGVIDYQPREVAADELATLTDLAGLTMDELEIRRAAREHRGQECDLHR